MPWWLWVAGGLVLLAFELATPSGFFLLFFGVSALVVGLLHWAALLPSATAQWLAFFAVSVASLLAFRGRLQTGIEHAPANIDTLVGELAIPRERILPGEVGRIDLRGAVWSARNDSPAAIAGGQRCRVMRVDGLLLSVAPE